MAPPDEPGADAASIDNLGVDQAGVNETRVAKSAVAPAPRAAYPYIALYFDPDYSRGSPPDAFSQNGPVEPDFALSAPASRAKAAAVAILQTKTQPDNIRPAAAQLALDIPLPKARPSELPLPALQNKTSVVATMTPDNRTLLQKIFGAPEPGPTLAYAAADGGVLGNGQSIAPGRMDAQTAVYDISARTVYMPDGSRLEAHSGYGGLLDDPRHVEVRMRGATPPAVYDLTPREQLFHGVQALRLTPVNSDVFGRTGLLAHTYMLGPNGDSNGCVSFRNYDEFLRAYQNGKVKRLVVVASLKNG